MKYLIIAVVLLNSLLFLGNTIELEISNKEVLNSLNDYIYELLNNSNDSDVTKRGLGDLFDFLPEVQCPDGPPACENI